MTRGIISLRRKIGKSPVSSSHNAKVPTRFCFVFGVDWFRYTVQWSSDESFGSGSGEAKVSAPTDDASNITEWITYTIEGDHHLWDVTINSGV